MPAHMKKKISAKVDCDNGNLPNDDVYNPLEDADYEISTKKKTGRSSSKSSNIDRRREVHVKCEHRRRKEIQDALDALEAELPPSHKPRSKGGVIVESAEMIKDLTFALDRLLNENQALLNRMQVNELTK